MIAVATDYDGLKLAAHELLDEGFMRDRGGERETGDMERSLSPGYYDRVDHLVELQAKLDAGITLTLRDVDDSEVRGLLAVRAARQEFAREHPPCPYCRAPQTTPFDRLCSVCGETLREAH